MNRIRVYVQLRCTGCKEHHSCHLFLHSATDNVVQCCTLISHFAHDCRNIEPSMLPFLKLEYFYKINTDPGVLPLSVKEINKIRLKLNKFTILFWKTSAFSDLMNGVIWCPHRFYSFKTVK